MSSRPNSTANAGQLRDSSCEPETLELAKLTPMFGWRLWVTIACLCSGLFLSSLETTIIATALVSISSSLGGYDRSNWVVTSYLVTYTGFLVIFARLSDMFGRKGTLCVSIVIFTGSSLACGLAQTMDLLPQGIGGAGLYSLAMAVIVEVTPLRFIGVSSGLIGCVFALSSPLGPLLGGIITSHTTWRWVFLSQDHSHLHDRGDSIPPGVILVLFLTVFPANPGTLPPKRQILMYMDYPGTVLSLVGAVMLTFVLEQGGLVYSWDSPQVVVGFVVSGAAFLAFVAWEWFISKSRSNSNSSSSGGGGGGGGNGRSGNGGKKRPNMLPLFPIHLVTRRVLGFALLTAFLAGFPFMTTIAFLPQRFQLQNGLSPVDAGIRMLALLTLSATGAGLGGIMAARRNISWYILVSSLSLQLVGLGLMSTLPTAAGEVRAEQYGYQVILSLGFGLGLSSLVVVARMEVDAEDVGVAFSAITQVRVFGGLIGIAVSQALLRARLLAELVAVLPTNKLKALLRSPTAVPEFTPTEAAATAHAYGDGFNLQNQVMLGFGAVGLLVCFGAWKRKPTKFADIEARLGRAEGEGQNGA